MIVKAFRISSGDYKRALKNGAEKIIAKSERPIDARVFELVPGEYWLEYKKEEKNGSRR